jgi:phosphatidylserine/phosphatidylglycerophosphate/cardiolipin synthase-like enzyme
VTKKAFTLIIALATASVCNVVIGEQIKSSPGVCQQTYSFCTDDTNPTYEAAFSPNDGAKDLVISTIKKAEKSIYVAAFSFTSADIADELVRAKDRGVDVKVICAKKRLAMDDAKFEFLTRKNVATRISHRNVMHNKFMIVDGKTLQLGSFNYTMAAEKDNDENVLVIHNSPTLVGMYMHQWQKLWDKAK